MRRWYDQMSTSCEGCLCCVTGEHPNGMPYRACRWYGYIFHEDLEMTDEPCPHRVTDAEKAAAPPPPKSIRQMGGRR